MDLITLSFSKNYIWAGLSTLGLGALTYFANRYNNNTAETTNQTYYKPIETKNYNGNINNINTINDNKPITYIFWNGDVGSTYLIIDLLLQDKIVQPLYIERYTIIRALEGERLKNLVNIKKNKKNDINYITHINDSNTKFLKEISILKHSQDYEIKQVEILRLIILAQYPEFRNNFLPTTYITTIAKDLEYTSQFYNTLKELSPVFYDGIEFIEQVVRFLKHYNNILEHSSLDTSNIIKSRIILGCNKEYKNLDLLLKLKNKSLVVGIDFPIIDMDLKTVKFMAVEFFPNDIMKYFLQVEKDKDRYGKKEIFRM